LSVRSVLPRFWEMERKYGSLTRATLQAMRQRRKAKAKGNSSGTTQPNSAGRGAAPGYALPLFMTLKGGLEELTGKLAEQLEPRRVHLGRRVTGIEAAPGGPGGTADRCSRRYQIFCEGGVVFDADDIILAMPTHECSRLLAPLHPALGGLLGAIPYSSSMTVSMGFAAGTSDRLPPGFGYLVPRQENRRMLACTFVHRKFNHRAPEGKALLRCFLGGSRDSAALNLSDQEAVSMVRKELAEILGFGFDPLFCRIHRWPASMAQYPVGHAERVALIHSQVGDLPGIYVAGNAYSGIGISDCIRSGRTAAQRVMGRITSDLSITK